MTKRERLLIAVRAHQLQQVKETLATPAQIKVMRTLTNRIKTKTLFHGEIDESKNIPFKEIPFEIYTGDYIYRHGAT